MSAPFNSLNLSVSPDPNVLALCQRSTAIVPGCFMSDPAVFSHIDDHQVGADGGQIRDSISNCEIDELGRGGLRIPLVLVIWDL